MADYGQERCVGAVGQAAVRERRRVPVHPPIPDRASPQSTEGQRLLPAHGREPALPFWELWQQHRGSLYAICLREMHGNQADAEDTLSDAMLQACVKLPEHGRNVTNLKAWLQCLTRNVCIGKHRWRSRTAACLRNSAKSADCFQPGTPAEEGVRRNEVEEELRRLIAGLPTRLREPCILRFLQQMSYADIAARLAISADNVRKRIQQARTLLRQRWDTGGTARDRAGQLPAPPRKRSAQRGQVSPRECPQHAPETAQVPAHSGPSRVVCLHLPSGLDVRFHIFLEKTPHREHQKIATLRRYVERHPRGWKKRLRLADLCYATGTWSEAIEAYRQVLSKHPWLTAVSIKLGNLLSLLARDQEALAVYEQALPLAEQAAARHHLEGLMAFVRQEYPAAATSFQQAALLEPHHPAHWHALAHAHLRACCFDEALRALEAALRINPHDLVALSCGHEALLALGRAEEAWQRVDRVLELAPEDALAHERRANRPPRKVGARNSTNSQIGP